MMRGNLFPSVLVFFPILTAFISYASGRKNKKVRDLIVQAAGITECLLFLAAAVFFEETQEMFFTWEGFAGLGMHLELDGFRVLYGLIAAFMWMMTALFSGEYFTHYRNRNRYYFFYLLTLGATVGVFLSSDLYTTFLFFELMSFTSYVWVAQDESKESLRAAATYLAVAVIGGLVMLMGLFLLYRTVGTLDMASLYEVCAACPDKRTVWAAGICLLFGFGAKAGAFPLHIWLPKAHPVAPAPASALLSGILTKAGIFGVLAVSCNIFLHDAAWGLLIFSIGLFTMFGGALLAVCSVDFKRTLACSSMSQIGFILLGIGMQGILGEENALAVRGTLLHMVNHSLIKLVLFMIAGVVVMNLHKLNLNEIQGFGKKKPLLHVCFLAGALGISGIPFFNGYVSKTLLHESIVEGIGHAAALSGFLKMSEWIFLISGGMTLAYMTKLYVAIFIEENRDKKEQERMQAIRHYMNPFSAFAIAGSAVILPVLGAVPGLVSDRAADLGQGFMHLEKEVHAVSYFSLENLKGGLISIAIGILLYAGIRKLMMKERDGVREYKDCWPKWLDLEELLYRPLLLTILPFLARFFCRILDSLADGVILLLRKTLYRDRKIPHELAEGSEFTHILGAALDFLRKIKRKILRQKAPEHEISYEHKLAMQREKFMETNAIIQRSLSFGLLLFYVGLVFTLIYLLYLGNW